MQASEFEVFHYLCAPRCIIESRRLQQESDTRSGHGGGALGATLPLGQSSVSGMANWTQLCVVYLFFEISQFAGMITLGNGHEKRLVHPAQPACIGNCRLRHVLNFSGSGSGAPEVLEIGVHLKAITLESGTITLSAPPANVALLDPSVPWIILPRSLVAEFCEQSSCESI